MLADVDDRAHPHGGHPDPFAVLGVHADAHGAPWLRCFLPGAAAVELVGGDGHTEHGPLQRRHADGFFEGACPAAIARDYRLQVHWADGTQALLDDPYRFGPVLGEMDVWLLGEGTHLRPFEMLGAHAARAATAWPARSFAVWAPNATRVSVVGDFNLWDGRRHPMRLRRECGVWEIFLPGVAAGARYKFELLSRDGQLLPLKADPYALPGRAAPGHRQRRRRRCRRCAAPRRSASAPTRSTRR